MKILDVIQGSPEWKAARAGVVTASCFDKILTPKTLKPAKATAYLHQLLAEWMLGRPVDEFQNYWMERGTELEPQAREFYEFAHTEEWVERVGFILRDDGQVGCSPDLLVGKDGGAEIKCPSPQVHAGYLLNPATLVEDYRYQIQGNLYVTGRKWWDALSYHDELDAVCERVERDETYLDALDNALTVFLKDLNEAKEKLAPHRLITGVAA